MICIALTVALGVRIVGGLLTAALVAIPVVGLLVVSITAIVAEKASLRGQLRLSDQLMRWQDAAQQALQRLDEAEAAIARLMAAQTPAELDPLMSLVEEIIDRFEGRRLETYPQAICVKAENEPVFSQEHIEQFRQFTSVIALTFRTVTE